MLFAPYIAYPLELIRTSLTSDIINGFGTTVTNIADELVGNTGDGQYDPRYMATYNTDNNSLAKYASFDTSGNDVNTYYFLRLAEVYLIQAESEARLGNFPAARTALKAITDRAGYAADYVDRIADGDLLLTIFRHTTIITNKPQNYRT